MRLSQGTETTLRAFFNSVHSYEDIFAHGNRVHNRRAAVVGYTLDTKDLNLLAGDKKLGFGWMWEAGNYLLTHEGKVYLFL